MDSFVGKIAQKINAQDIIRANAEAEAAEMSRLKGQTEKMRKQLEQYDLCMQEMRKLNLKNAESAQAIRELVEEVRAAWERMQKDNLGTEDKLGRLAEDWMAQMDALRLQGDDREKILARLEELQILFSDFKSGLVELQRTFTGQHQELAELRELFSLQREELTKLGQSFSDGDNKTEELRKLLDGQKSELEDIIHKENVKVYRNVQAVVLEELEKQNKANGARQEKEAGRNKALLTLVVISMMVGLGNLGLMIVRILGLL